MSDAGSSRIDAASSTVSTGVEASEAAILLDDFVEKWKCDFIRT
jgi:hypothetical protein